MAEPEPHDSADAIFVFAWREARKKLGVQLFREGRAPLLILSVGRFEWRKFASLGLPGDGGLLEMVPLIEPRERHFFVRIGPEGAMCDRIARGKLGTWTEARALAGLIERERWAKVLVVSSRAHLPRCLLSLRAFLSFPCAVVPVACEDAEGSEECRAALGELAKFSGYTILAGLTRLRRGGSG